MSNNKFTLIGIILAFLLFGCLSDTNKQNATGNSSTNDGNFTINASNPTPQLCEDSDFGKDIFVKGSLTLNGNTYSDECRGEQLREYYCGANNSLVSETITCPTNYVCKEGACIEPPKCSDSDSGMNYFKGGSVTFGGVTYEDKCIDASKVNEYYCEGNKLSNATADCPSGYSCANGQCNNYQESCLETDNGKNVLQKGQTEVYSGGAKKTYTDICYDDDTVSEYYCVGSGFTSTKITCPNDYICYNGECVVSNEADCIDDDGKDIYTKGETLKGSDSSLDKCYDNDTVTEYYCSSNEIKSAKYDCPSNYECSSGKCIEKKSEDMCTDSDGGKNWDEIGTTKKGGFSYTDKCFGAITAAEYYCDAQGNIVGEKMTCDSGSFCSDAKCVKAQCTDSDGGYTVSNKGTVTQKAGSYQTSNTDSCYDSNTVREWGCLDESNIAYSDIACGAGLVCYDGKCDNACTDSDGGNDKLKLGTTKKGASSSTDYCISYKTIAEYYCKNNDVTSNILSCGDGYSCSSGKCIETCEETDSGNDVYQKGITYKGANQYTDECININEIEEYYCAGNTINIDYKKCSQFFTCSNGKCVSPT